MERGNGMHTLVTMENDTGNTILIDARPLTAKSFVGRLRQSTLYCGEWV